MELTRREALRSVVSKCVPVAAAALAIPAAEAGETASQPAAPIGMLYDATLCIGCKACVVACAEANELPRDVSLDGLHQAPADLNAFTKNIIKLYKPQKDSPDSFVKQQCMHCLDPACVAACPFKALWKNDENGVVAWEPSRCIGCRYCEIACPYHVPKFEWNAFNAKIVKCEFCRPRLNKGYEPACTSVCPTHAVVFGPRKDLLSRAKQRIADSPKKYFEDRVYGEHEAGGTQVLYLSQVPFEDIGLPNVGTVAIPERLKWQKRIYRFLALPLLLYAMLTSVMKKNWIDHQKEMREEEEKTGLKAQL
jgi:formate dehydrogenase beta subunit